MFKIHSFIVGLFAVRVGVFNLELAPAIVSVGSFIAIAIIEASDLKTFNDDKK